MNKQQKTIMAVALLLIAASLIFVPYKAPSGSNLGYSTIFTPIKYSYRDHKTIEYTKDASLMLQGAINYERLLLQALSIALVALATVIVFPVLWKKER